MTRDTNYQLNIYGFYQQSYLILLQKMLEMAGYKEGSPEFEALVKRALERMRCENMEKVCEFSLYLNDPPKTGPTATGAQIKSDPSIPVGELQFRDPQTGQVLGRIIDIDGEAK